MALCELFTHAAIVAVNCAQIAATVCPGAFECMHDGQTSVNAVPMHGRIIPQTYRNR
jgi:hypothetical protein